MGYVGSKPTHPRRFQSILTLAPHPNPTSVTAYTQGCQSRSSPPIVHHLAAFTRINAVISTENIQLPLRKIISKPVSDCVVHQTGFPVSSVRWCFLVVSRWRNRLRSDVFEKDALSSPLMSVLPLTSVNRRWLSLVVFTGTLLRQDPQVMSQYDKLQQLQQPGI